MFSGRPPADWRQTTLGELCSGDSGAIQTGPFGSQLHASDYRETGIPVVNPTHLRLNAIDEEHLPRISAEDAGRLSRHNLREGDILISRRGDFSRYSYIGAKQSGWLCGTGCLRIRLTQPEVDNRFLAASFSLDAVQNYLSHAAVGSIMPNLNTNILRDVPLLLPSLREQQAIANGLEHLQAALELQQREVDLELERKQALMDYVFARGTRSEILKDSERGKVPSSWTLTTLNKVCKGIPQNGAFVKEARFGHGTFYVNVYDIYQSTVLAVERVQRLDWNDPAKAKYLLHENDILFVRSSLKRDGIAQCCVVGELIEPAIFDCHLIRVSPDPHIVNPLFLAYFFSSPASRTDLIARSKTTTMTTINQNNLLESTVVLPDKSEQDEISKLLSGCDASLAALNDEIGFSKELLKALREELMGGRLPPLSGAVECEMQ